MIMSKVMQVADSNSIEAELKKYPQMYKYCGKVLMWLWNRPDREKCTIFGHLRYNGGLNALESLLTMANSDRNPITNFQLIFPSIPNTKTTTTEEIDQALGDAFTEVHLCDWLQKQGFSNIQKLREQKKRNARTPDFSAYSDKQAWLCEAKRLRLHEDLKLFEPNDIGRTYSGPVPYSQIKPVAEKVSQKLYEKAKDCLAQIKGYSSGCKVKALVFLHSDQSIFQLIPGSPITSDILQAAQEWMVADKTNFTDSGPQVVFRRFWESTEIIDEAVWPLPLTQQKVKSSV